MRRVPDAAALPLSLVVLAAALAAAVVRPPRAPEWAVAAAGALLLTALGAVDRGEALDTAEELAPTIGFLAALLLIAEGCRRDGLFDSIGAVLARRAGGSPRRLLALVFAVAATVTAALSLDATVVLLTPVVLATAARLRTSPRPHVVACAHLANSASLLLPVSNLTNLLAFHASGLSFLRFAALMALPALAVIAIEWVALSRFFATELRRPRAARPPALGGAQLPRRPLAVVAATLIGFAVSGAAGIEPVWVALAGAAALTLPALARREALPAGLARAAEPGFLVFVLGLGVIVAAASEHGLADAVGALVPSGDGLLTLLAVAAVGAVLANLVNNLPATLLLVPVAAAGGPGVVLAALIGVNVGPNLTYVGSLATLLWRRILRHEDEDVDAAEFFRLALLTVPAGVIAATLLLWCSLQLVGT